MTAPYRFPEFVPGSVWLVGAGPGDPGLLTLLGRHALETCDALVHDALVDEALLGFANPDAERHFVGKRGGRPSPKQAEITARIVALAGQGKRVLRLKGGDPFVFGRGAEEVAALVTAGIPFRVVPGVTAGVAAPAYAGLPVTAKDTNSAVTFLTGHDAGGGLPEDLDWTALARSGTALVFYMGLRTLPEIVSRLREGGRSAEEPAAVIASGTTPDQTSLVTTLGRLADDVEAHGLKAPAVVYVGGAAVYAVRFAWWPHDRRVGRDG